MRAVSTEARMEDVDPQNQGEKGEKREKKNDRRQITQGSRKTTLQVYLRVGR
jgi:hypothetical protein